MHKNAWRARQEMMGRALACLVCSALGGYVLLQSAVAQQEGSIVYKPPLRGAPGGREGAGSRGPGDPLPALVVFTPQEHTGFTIQEQPVLYWYLSQETQHPVEVTLTDRQSITPLLDVRLAPPLQPGIHRVRLADYGIRLAPEVVYKWAVALVPNQAERSQDVVSAGTIVYTPVAAELRHRLSQADQATAARLYAAHGLWYDTIAALSALIEAAPQHAMWRQQRATLLEQEHLVEAAAYDRQQK